MSLSGVAGICLLKIGGGSVHKQDGLSATHEMYLKIIYQLSQSGDAARVGQMAKGLGVHPSTVSAVVRTLARMDLVTHDTYGVVKLTDMGERFANCVVRRFEILHRFFTEVLGFDEEAAALEACEVEHAISPVAIGRIDRLADELPELGFKPSANVSSSVALICSECPFASECALSPAERD